MKAIVRGLWFSVILVILLFVFTSCGTLPQYLDTKPPLILIFSPIQGKLYHGSVDVKVQVIEVYEKGPESGLKSVEVALLRSNLTKIFQTNLLPNGNEVTLNMKLSLPNNYESFTLSVKALDKHNNSSSKEVYFFSSSSPVLYMSIDLPTYVTNTNFLTFGGIINITKEFYGDVEYVKVVVSNPLGVFTNNASSFSSYNWVFSGYLPMAEVGDSNTYNTILAFMKTTSNYHFTSLEVYFYYDTNKPFTTVLDPLNGQEVAKNFLVKISNHDNYLLDRGSLLVIKENTTNTIGYTPYFLNYLTIELQSSGEYVLVPYIRDRAGNEYYGTPINVRVDLSKPSISLFSPARDFQEILTNSNLIVFSGSALVDGGFYITNISLLVYTNNTLVYSNTRTYNSPNVNWHITNLLLQGTNLVKYYAVANNGKTSATNSIIVVVDYIKPIAEILFPTNGQELTISLIPVITYVDDTNFSLGCKGELYLNGSLFNSSLWGENTNFLSLTRGSNVIEVVSIDMCNNTNVDRVVVYYFDGVYVSVRGNDTNRGSFDSPFRSINKGIAKATNLGVTNIFVSIGAFSPGNGLNPNENGVTIMNITNLEISGGWNENFTYVVGYSDLNGMGTLYHVVFAKDSYGITLRNLLIRGGKANSNFPPHNSGGGILFSNVAGSIIANVIVSNNSASVGGGGIQLYFCENNTIHATVSKNTSVLGGGIRITSSTNNIIHGSVYSNTATKGGGIYIDGSSAHNSVVGDIYDNACNENSGCGGGIGLESTSFVSIFGKVYKNRAMRGGGVWSQSSDNIRISSEIYDNVANFGGGLFLTNNSQVILLDNTSVASNLASGAGGGIACYGSRLSREPSNPVTSNVLISFNLVSNASGAGVGGGIYVSGCSNLSLSNLTLFSNVVRCNSNGAGGGIFVTLSSNVRIENSKVLHNIVLANTDTFGGGIGVSLSGGVMIVSSRVAGNRLVSGGSILGGGIGIITSTNVEIAEVEVENNFISNTSSVGTNFGGGVCILSTSNVTVQDTEVNFNTNSGGNYRAGGGILIAESSQITLSNLVHVRTNTLTYGGIGGGIVTSKVNVMKVDNSHVLANNGRGIVIVLSTNLVIQNSQIMCNLDGGIEINTSTNSGIVSSLIAMNTNTTSVGGGIYILSDNSHIFVSNSTISSNYGLKGGGIGVIESSVSPSGFAKITVHSNTISHNYAHSSKGGGGVYAENRAKLTITSNILANNLSSVPSATITLYGGGAWENLKIVGNTFSGKGITPTAIWEDGIGGVYDILNHTIQSNSFHLSTYTNLYRDPNGVGFPSGEVFIPSDTNGINILNTQSSPYHDAISVGGNIGM